MRQIEPRGIRVEQRYLLYLVGIDSDLLPVAIENEIRYSRFISDRESTIDDFLALDPDDVLSFVVQDDDRDTPTEVLEVLAHTEEVRREGVCKEEIVDLRLDRGVASVRVVLEPVAVTNLCVEHLTGREGLVFLDQFKDMVRQVIIRAPRHVLRAVGEGDWGYFGVFFEDLGRIDGEHDRCASVGKLFDRGVVDASGVSRGKRIPHIFVFCAKVRGLYGGGKDSVISRFLKFLYIKL